MLVYICERRVVSNWGPQSILRSAARSLIVSFTSCLWVSPHKFSSYSVIINNNTRYNCVLHNDDETNNNSSSSSSSSSTTIILIVDPTPPSSASADRIGSAAFYAYSPYMRHGQTSRSRSWSPCGSLMNKSFLFRASFSRQPSKHLMIWRRWERSFITRNVIGRSGSISRNVELCDGFIDHHLPTRPIQGWCNSNHYYVVSAGSLVINTMLPVQVQ